MALNIPGIVNLAHCSIDEHLRAVDIEPPAGVTYALAIDAALRQAAQPDLTAEVRDLIADQTPPAKVSAHLTKVAAQVAAADRVEAARQELQRDLDRHARAALLTDVERIFEELADKFDTAVAAVREAFDTFGSDRPPADVLARPRMAELWEQAEAARRHLHGIVEVRTDLADVGYGSREQNPAWYLVVPRTLLEGPSHKLEDLVEQGHALQLNTATETAELLDHAAKLQSEAEATAAAARARSIRSSPDSRWLAAEEARMSRAAGGE